MPQEAWPGRGPWPVPATPALVPKQGPRSLVTRSLQIQVISPGSKSPNPPRSHARRSQAPTRKGLGALGRQHRCPQDLGVRRKMALTGCSWLLLSGEREWCPPEPRPPVASGKGGGLWPGEGTCEQKSSILDREGSCAPRRHSLLLQEAPAWAGQGQPPREVVRVDFGDFKDQGRNLGKSATVTSSFVWQTLLSYGS